MKTSFKGILGTFIIFGLIVLVIYEFTKDEPESKTIIENEISLKDRCGQTEAFLFDIENINIATTKRLVVTLNVPANSEITYEQLKSEAECYAIKVFKDRETDVLAVNIFWSKESYKTFKGDIFCGKIVYAPFGNWANDKEFTKEDYKFDYTSFKKKYFRKSLNILK